MLNRLEVDEKYEEGRHHFTRMAISSRYVRDTFILEAYTIATSNSSEYISRLKGRLDRLVVNNIMNDYLITFDETLWLPDDKGAYENIIRLDWNHGLSMMHHLTIDLRNSMTDYISEIIKT